MALYEYGSQASIVSFIRLISLQVSHRITQALFIDLSFEEGMIPAFHASQSPIILDVFRKIFCLFRLRKSNKTLHLLPRIKDDTSVMKEGHTLSTVVWETIILLVSHIVFF